MNVSVFSVASLVDCGVSANRAGEDGGGLILLGSEARPTEVKAERCQFVENQAERNGGGLNVNDFSVASLVDCGVSANRAGNNGGGLGSVGREGAPHRGQG